MDLAISGSIYNRSVRVKNKRKLFDFCSDLPNVMVATRKLLTGERDGGSNFVVFIYVCLFLALSNFLMDLRKEQHVRNTLTEALNLA